MTLLGLLFGILLAAFPARAGEAARHSGLLVAVSPAQGTVTLDEIGAWYPGAPDVRRVVALTPLTRVVLVSRAPGRARDGWPGGFNDAPLLSSALRAGDYANMTVAARDGQLVAISITVIRPDQPAGAPRAAPRPTGSTPGGNPHVA
jgi:hypothetical protein